MNVFTLQCNDMEVAETIFADWEECGTFVEIHRAFDERVIEELRI